MMDLISDRSRRRPALRLALAAAAALAAAGGRAGGQETLGFANLGFEDGTKGWRVWYSDDPRDSRPKYPYAADAGVARSGKRSLRITATAQGGNAFVHQTSTGLKPDTRYEISYWYRLDGAEDGAFRIVLNLWQTQADGRTRRMTRLTPMLVRRRREGPWRQRVGRVRTLGGPRDAQLGIELRDTTGTVWVDDIEIRPLAKQPQPIAEMLEYDPYRVELLAAPERTFRKLNAAKAGILELAKAYNRALVRSAFAADEVQQLARAAGYAEAHGLKADPAALQRRCREMENALGELYRLYGRCYYAQADAALCERFGQAADRLAGRIAALRRDARAAVRALQDALRKRGTTWPGQPAPLNAGLPAVGPDGRPNQIIFGTRSLFNHADMEAPLDIRTLHCTSIPYPRSSKPGEYDCGAYLKRWQEMTALCPAIRRSCVPIWFAVHDTSYCPSWLARRIKDDGELRHQTDPPQALRNYGGRTQLNWWHPEVRAFARDALTRVGRAMKPHRQFLFYINQAECHGPDVSAAGRPWRREVGYCSHGKRDFRRYLKGKYGTIARLNEAWSSRYAGFASVEPPADKFVQPRKRPTPLSAEWETWREDSFIDWCKLIYDSLKLADGRPVLASHSQLLERINAARAYETCDILGYHHHAPRFMINTIYINSISRYNGFKPVGQYENFWGCQEHHDRMAEELIQRRNVQKHVFRLTAWGRFVQIWWYAYTTADYLTRYDGNWFGPVYALTTLRYRVAALPVYKEKFKRIERALLASRLAHHRVCVLQPSASMRNQYPYDATFAEIRAYFELLFPRNWLFEIVPEEYLQAGRAKLADFDVLILPYAVDLPGDVQGRVERWLGSGRKLLIASGPFGLRDELARPAGKLFRRLTGAGRCTLVEPPGGGWQWRVERGGKGGGEAEDVLRRRHKQADIIVLLRPLARLADRGGELLAAIEAAADRPAVSRQDRFELVLRDGADGARYLLALNGDVDEPREDVVRVLGRYAHVEDIDVHGAFPVTAERQGQATSFRLRLAPCEMAALRLRP